MALHYLFIILILVPIGFATGRYFLDPGAEMVFHDMVQATFDYGVKGIRLVVFSMLPLMILWMGILNVAERSGAIKMVAWLVNPFFNKLFPGVPSDHPARGSIVMNYAANMLGLDNAATPVGLRAIGQLQELNPNKEVATNAQIMFLVLNTSGLSILPVGVFIIREAGGAEDITSVFVPVLIATYCATLVALIIVSIYQKINLFNPTVFAYIGITLVMVLGVMFYFKNLPQKDAERVAGLIGDSLYIFFIGFFFLMGVVRKVNIFDAFIDGAQTSWDVAKSIFPYIVGFLVATGIFVESGCMNILMDGLRSLVDAGGGDTGFVEAIPVALMKPVNGKAAQAMVLEVFENCNQCGGVGAVVQDSLLHLKGSMIPLGAADTMNISWDFVNTPQLTELFKDTLSVKMNGPFLNSPSGAALQLYNETQPVACNCADTFAGKLASTVQGTTDTTFYIIAVYFGSVGIKKIRYALWAGLLADLAGIIAAIVVAYIFF